MSPSTIFRRLLLSLVLSALAGPLSAATWVVKKGETCYRIARANGVTPAALMAANGIKDPTQLRIGQKLTIPGKKAASPKKAPLVVKTTPVKTAKPQRARAKVQKVAVSSRSSSVSSTKRPSSSFTKRLRVIVDAGHGGKDKGAYWYGVSEAALNLKVARRVERSLKDRGYQVTMTRRSDRYLTLSRRSSIANRYRNAIFVSIHFNACHNTQAHGVETFYAGKRGRFLAQCIQTRLVRSVKARNRGVRAGRYAVLMQTKCPAVLVECGFISNPRERSRCNSLWYQKATAKAIVDGIARYDRVY